MCEILMADGDAVTVAALEFAAAGRLLLLSTWSPKPTDASTNTFTIVIEVINDGYACAWLL